MSKKENGSMLEPLTLTLIFFTAPYWGPGLLHVLNPTISPEFGSVETLYFGLQCLGAGCGFLTVIKMATSGR